MGARARTCVQLVALLLALTRSPRPAEAASVVWRDVAEPQQATATTQGRNELTYDRIEGFLAAGSDLGQGDHTLGEAKQVCDANPICMGFTFRVGDSDMQPKLDQVIRGIYFKSRADSVLSPGWLSYTKNMPPEYPDKNFTIGGLRVSLRRGSHTVQVLGLVEDDMPPYNFSFVPPLKGPGRPTRSQPTCHHLGDVTLRVRPANVEPSGMPAKDWAMYSSSSAPPFVQAVPLEPNSPGVFASDDITPMLEAEPTQQPFPLGLKVTRSFESAESEDGASSLVIRWNLTNVAGTVVRVGGLGFSLPSDATTSGLKLEEIAHTNSFVDPHIGGDHAFAEWLRVVGNRSLLVVPHTRSARMEAWRPLLEDCAFDGERSEWTVLSGAWAEEWEMNQQAPIWEMDPVLAKTGVWPEPQSPWPSWHSHETLSLRNVTHWNPPTYMDLQPGEEATYALRFVLGRGGPRTRDGDLRSAGITALHAVPGYTIATDMSDAALLVLPPSATVGVRSVVSDRPDVLRVGAPVAQTSGGFVEVRVTGLKRGRVRVVVKLEDGSEAYAHYHVLPPFHEQVASLGKHWSTNAWLPREFPDPFGRSASVMPWDREDHRHILQDSRAYIVGLSDDAGAANNLGFATKVNFAPLQEEVSRVDEYIKWTLYGVKPDVALPPLRSLQDPETDGIRMTMFYYPDPPPESGVSDSYQPITRSSDAAAVEAAAASGTMNFPYNYTEADKCRMPVSGPIWCMIEGMANATYRGYNNPHQTAVYYAMYRVARNYDRLVFEQPWQWYLERAWKTMKFIGSASVGFMDGTIFREVLLALKEEGATNSTIAEFAQEAEANMRARADQWAEQTFPYGSEFNFDTTGQEEVYIWLMHFNYTEQAARTRDAIMGYMRSLPNWAWNGGSRSMGDLGNNGKWFINRGVERGLMHYRSGLNMIPLIEAYRANPDDHLLLEISMGAMAGQMANIDENGATSMMFHSLPFVNEYDPHSGDYGLGFFGHSLEAGAYFVNLSSWGPRCYLCDLQIASAEPARVKIIPRDSYRQRIFLEPLGLYVVARTGRIAKVMLDISSRKLDVHLVPDVASVSSSDMDSDEGNSCLYQSTTFSQYSVQVQKTSMSRPGTGFRPVRKGFVKRTTLHKTQSVLFHFDPNGLPENDSNVCGGNAKLRLTWDSEISSLSSPSVSKRVFS